VLLATVGMSFYFTLDFLRLNALAVLGFKVVALMAIG
jgi:hypothetical protein